MRDFFIDKLTSSKHCSWVPNRQEDVKRERERWGEERRERKGKGEKCRREEGKRENYIINTFDLASGILQYQDFPGGPVAKLCSPNTGGPGFNPCQGARSHMLQLRVHIPQLRPGKAK